MDFLDEAQEREAIKLAEALERQRIAGELTALKMRPTGACLFCGEPLDQVKQRGFRFCDADCREDFDFEQRAKNDPRNRRIEE